MHAERELLLLHAGTYRERENRSLGTVHGKHEQSLPICSCELFAARRGESEDDFGVVKGARPMKGKRGAESSTAPVVWFGALCANVNAHTRDACLHVQSVPFCRSSHTSGHSFPAHKQQYTDTDPARGRGASWNSAAGSNGSSV